MKPEQLKLYNKYKHNKYPNTEFIYIGKGNNYNNNYFFICKNEYRNININVLNKYGLNSEQIIKDLNLETYIDNIDIKRIKNYGYEFIHKSDLIYFKLCLKNKLKNIINR